MHSLFLVLFEYMIWALPEVLHLAAISEFWYNHIDKLVFFGGTI